MVPPISVRILKLAVCSVALASPGLKAQDASTVALRVAEQTIKPGDSISYNRTFIAKRPSIIAVLPIGYADGYSRKLSNKGCVLIKGRRAPIVGLVCMDMTMVDVTDLPSVRIGDTVTVIGQDGNDAIWADEIAQWSETIPYEVLCAIGPRIPRVYTSP